MTSQSDQQRALPQVEPSADQRNAAKSLFAMYAALLQEGFNEDQAITLIGNLLVAVITESED